MSTAKITRTCSHFIIYLPCCFIHRKSDIIKKWQKIKQSQNFERKMRETFHTLKTALLSVPHKRGGQKLVTVSEHGSINMFILFEI